MSLGEFQLISRYFKSASQPEDVSLGIGDDAAILQVPPGHQLAVSSDTLVESVHFPKNAPADLVARRALRVNLSDMAAMAAQPRWFTLALTLEEAEPEWLELFSEALHKEAEAFGCHLVGGDTTRGGLNIGIQIMGTLASESQTIKRSGAKAGDLLVVTGTLGDAAAALDYLEDDPSNESASGEDIQYLKNRYWLPEPRVDFALRAHSIINAACDISDGLLGDAGHICQQSQLGATVEVEKTPMSAPLTKLSGSASLEKALTGGDDYELCMAVSPNNLQALELIAKEQSIAVTVVGTFHAGEGISCIDKHGKPLPLSESGYQHFL